MSHTLAFFTAPLDELTARLEERGDKGDAEVDAANARLLDLLARKEIVPLVDTAYPLAEAARAQRHHIEGGPFGRVLLAV